MGSGGGSGGGTSSLTTVGATMPTTVASAGSTANSSSSWQDDGRLVSMLGWAQECLPTENPHLLPKFFAKNKEILEELLADRKKFK